MKVLLVEDHPFQRDVIASQLSRLLDDSDSICQAATGLEALSFLNDSHPDLMLCDLQMPELDGIQFLSRSADLGFTGYIVITSASNEQVMETVRQMCQSYNLNVLGCMPKPVDIKILETYVSKARNPANKKFSPLSPLSDRQVEEAYQNGWITSFYQPLVSLENGEWIGNEALVRLVHPGKGVIQPWAFLPQLIRQGHESKLTLSAIDDVIDKQFCLGSRPVAINVSSSNLVAEGFVDSVLKLAEKHPKLNRLIYFEIIESDEFNEMGRAQEAASRLAMRGFKLAIDDFGTGYSTLQQLESLPFESLKVDLGFVLPMLTSKSCHAIVEACFLLASRLSLQTVAEGVESIDIWHELRRMDCNIAQGYFIAKPMPASQLPIWYELWQFLIEAQTLCPDIEKTSNNIAIIQQHK